MIQRLMIIFSLVLACSLTAADYLRNNGKFPDDFPFGVATASYQIEGGWNQGGKGLSVWDTFVHRKPSPIVNNYTADIACDSYHRWREDIYNVASLGVQYYRFSISWPRILPNGYMTKINHQGLAYYRNLIQEIIRYKMVPVVTIFHWDLPQRLVDDGLDWTNHELIDVFVDYARFVISNFPQVNRWITINEPRVMCRFAYGEGLTAPGFNGSGIFDYQCSYVVLKAHAAVYHMYKNEFPHYRARMSVVIDCQWYEPDSPDCEDIEAANRQMEFECGTYFHPIFKGDWPSIVKSRIAERSRLEGYSKSRLPQFTPEEIAFIKGTHDYVGLNHYFTFLAGDEPEAPYCSTNYENDLRVVNSRSPTWELGSNQWGIVPWGVRKVLNWIEREYGHQDILITEIGVADNGIEENLIDEERIDYYTDYFCEILEAMQIDGISVLGITAWSLMDNFEWNSGYSVRFGLFNIDFDNDRSLTRRPKKSASFFKQLTTTRQLQCGSYNREWAPPSWGPQGKQPHKYDN